MNSKKRKINKKFSIKTKNVINEVRDMYINQQEAQKPCD